MGQTLSEPVVEKVSRRKIPVYLFLLPLPTLGDARGPFFMALGHPHLPTLAPWWT